MTVDAARSVWCAGEDQAKTPVDRRSPRRRRGACLETALIAKIAPLQATLHVLSAPFEPSFSSTTQGNCADTQSVLKGASQLLLSPLSGSAWAVRSSVLFGYDSHTSLVFTADQGRTWQPRANPCSLKTTGSPSAVDFATSTLGCVICTWEPAGGLQTKALYETTDGRLLLGTPSRRVPGVSPNGIWAAERGQSLLPGVRTSPANTAGWPWLALDGDRDASVHQRRWRKVASDR